MKKRYFIRQKVAVLYIVLYALALATLLIVGFSPALKGNIGSFEIIVAVLFIAFLFIMLFREVKKGLFDVIIVENDFLILSRFGKKAYLSWHKVEFIDVKSYKKSGGEKFIIVTFMKNTAGEDLQLKIDYREGLYKMLVDQHGKIMASKKG